MKYLKIKIVVCFFAVLFSISFIFADTMKYYYDSVNRLVEVDYGTGQGVQYIYDQNGNLVKRKSSQGLFYISHIDFSSAWETYLIIDNTGDNVGRATLTLYSDGSQVSSKIHVVEAGKTKSIKIEAGQCGIVTKGGDSITLREAFVNIPNKGIAEFSLTNWASTELDFLLPHYHADNLSWMGLAFMNVGTATTQAHLTVYGPDGDVLGTAEVELDVFSNAVGILESFFPELDFHNVARVHISADQPLTGINISGFSTKRLLFTKATDNVLPAGVHFLPHIANQWNTWQNYLVLDNLGDQSGETELRLYSGGELVITQTVTVPAQSNVLVNINDYKDQNPDCGVISVRSNQLAVRQCYISNTGGTAEFQISPFSDPNLICNFPSYITSQLEWMGIALYNTTSVAETYQLQAVKSGTVVEETSLEIGAYSRVADLLSNLFPTSYNSGIDRVIVNGEKPLFSIVISGSSLERLLFMPGSISR